MSGFQKTQLLESMGVLEEAVNILKEQQPGAEKINLCADIQEYILAILNFLDNIGEKETKLTEGLAELYKTLLKVSQDEIAAEELSVQVDSIYDSI